MLLASIDPYAEEWDYEDFVYDVNHHFAKQLGKKVFVEGGGVTVSCFLNAGLLDRLHVMVAPMIIGSGRPAFSLPEIDFLDDALRPRAQLINLGSDMLFDLDFTRDV